MSDANFIERVVRLGAAFSIIDDLAFIVITEDGYWAGDGNLDGNLTANVNCNDLFYWASADLEPIENEVDLEMLHECLELDVSRGAELYACRRRKMRPQNCVLSKIPDQMKPHFEACGPPRTNEECG